jgi:hypothetical protein
MLSGLAALAALFILLPGFMSARITQIMSARSEKTELDRIIQALIFSFFTYAIYLFIFGPVLPLAWTVNVDKLGVPHYTFLLDRWKFIFLVLLALILGTLWGFLQSRDLLSRLLLKLRLTNRTSRESIWEDVLLNQAGYVQVGLQDGRNAIGWLSRYSDYGEERALFLERASWINDAGETVDIPGAGLLLTDKSEIQFIMFLDDVK